MILYTSYISKISKLDAQGILPVAIVNYLPRNLHVMNLSYLSPPAQTLAKYKKIKDSKVFTMEYAKYLNTLNINEVLNHIESIMTNHDNKTIALVCYEKSGDFCHRHILAEWIEQSTRIEAISEWSELHDNKNEHQRV